MCYIFNRAFTFPRVCFRSKQIRTKNVSSRIRRRPFKIVRISLRKLSNLTRITTFQRLPCYILKYTNSIERYPLNFSNSHSCDKPNSKHFSPVFRTSLTVSRPALIVQVQRQSGRRGFASPSLSLERMSDYEQSRHS